MWLRDEKDTQNAQKYGHRTMNNNIVQNYAPSISNSRGGQRAAKGANRESDLSLEAVSKEAQNG
jgi:hypothetical protein